MELWGLCWLDLLKSLPAFFVTKSCLALKEKSMDTQMSTAIETRGVAGFDSVNPGIVLCLPVTNRISIAAASISVLAHSLIFMLITNMYSWVITAVYQMY